MFAMSKQNTGIKLTFGEMCVKWFKPNKAKATHSGKFLLDNGPGLDCCQLMYDAGQKAAHSGTVRCGAQKPVTDSKSP